MPTAASMGSYRDPYPTTNANNLNKVPGQYYKQFNQETAGNLADTTGQYKRTPPLEPNIAYALDQLLNRGYSGLMGHGQGFGQNQIQNLFGQTAQGLGQGQQQVPGTQNLLQQTLQGASGGFQPIENRARQQFETKTIPGLAERFTSMGGNSRQGSSAFQGALGSAGSDLEQGLAALRSQYGLQEQGQRQNLLSNLFQQGNQQQQLQQGLFGQLLGGGQQNESQGLQLLQNMLTQGLQPRHEYGFQPAPPSFLGNVGQGAGQAGALALAGLLKSYGLG